MVRILIFFGFGGPDLDDGIKAYFSVLDVMKSSSVNPVQNTIPLRWVDILGI